MDAESTHSRRPKGVQSHVHIHVLQNPGPPQPDIHTAQTGAMRELAACRGWAGCATCDDSPRCSVWIDTCHTAAWASSATVQL